MATARCYTKSGSVEKYESNLWVSPTLGNWSSSGVVGTITTPDSRGNYTVTPANGFEDSNTQTGFYCYTMYGGVRKTFYFKEKDTTITIRVEYKVYGYNYNGCVAFNCSVLGNIYGTPVNDATVNNILKNNSIYLSWEVVTNNGPFGNYKTRITSVGSLILNTWSYYDNSKQYYISERAYCNPSSGMYNGNNWNTHVIGGT